MTFPLKKKETAKVRVETVQLAVNPIVPERDAVFKCPKII
jgi:hypothetical protein